MARSRVLSFMSTFSGPAKSTQNKSQSQDSFGTDRDSPPFQPPQKSKSFHHVPQAPPEPAGEPVQARMAGRQRSTSRPMSMIGGYQPPLMQIASDTIPELAPIFTFLNSHSNKLYQEGYFLKLNDLDTHGRPYPERLWTECFAQLVGTVLSLWDAAALDAAGGDGEVAPTFMNLADASIKMVETLPTRSQDTQPLTNVLSVSTAGKNRFLFHFSSVNALTQWTAGIRLAMFENSSLQEAYTGSLIAGKGKGLNNIKAIMERTRFKTEEWTRVRFGAGTPWRRCWCVIAPADEKEIAAQRKATKKRSAYDRGLPNLKGDIKFYDTRKITKKTQPIATIRDAYSAYAIYPQSKPLIEQSTLIKIEGLVTIHTNPEVTTEGLIFVMPEVRPAISGFEMMLRFIFPVYDIFALYGRPQRLVADTLDSRSLMFAMPSDRRYGYLEIFDIATLIHQPGSSSWSEREWKKQLKQLTAQRISKVSGGHRSHNSSRVGSRNGNRNSMPGRSALRFQDNASSPSLHHDLALATQQPTVAESTPPGEGGPFPLPRTPSVHKRSASESHPMGSPRKQPHDPGAGYTPSRLSQENSRARMSIEDGEEETTPPPLPPSHGVPMPPPHMVMTQSPTQRMFSQHDMDSSDGEHTYHDASEPEHPLPPPPPSELDLRPHLPVAAPPAFLREPGAKPQARPYQAPELRRANSRMSSATLSQLAAAGRLTASEAAAIRADQGVEEEPQFEEGGYRGVNDYNTVRGSAMSADDADNQGLALAMPPSSATSDAPSKRSVSPSQFHRPLRPTEASSSQPGLTAPPNFSRRSASPLYQATSVTDAGTPPAQPTQEERPNTASTSDSHPSSSGLHAINRKSITRKPVPTFPKPASAPTSSGNTAEAPSLNFLDPTLSGADYHGLPENQESRRRSDNSSRNDTYSTDSPDYASTHESIEPSQPAIDRDKPRSGVLRTVGTVDPAEREVVIGDARYRPGTGEDHTADFTVDFGPTQLYNPVISTQERASPDAPQSYGKAPSRSAGVTPEPGQSRPSPGGSPSHAANRRSMVWQPGVAPNVGTESKQALTPEQFIQQRYATSRNTAPVAHGRNPSSTPPRADSRQSNGTPPLTRNSSGDWSAQLVHGQPPRPGSRGATRTLSTDLSSHLSAREQEHVARMTGSPLINMAGNPAKPVPQGGLVGAIGAREKEKEDFKKFHSNMAVQQAIAQRHSQQYYGQPSPAMNVPGQFPPSPQHYENMSNQYDYMEGPHGPPQQPYRMSQGYYPPQQAYQEWQQGPHHQNNPSN